LREQYRTVSENQFNMEFGAQFSGVGEQKFLTKDQVQQCFTGHSYIMREKGLPGRMHFVHIDPASSSHNYALAVGHKEPVRIDGRSDFYIVIDHIKFWEPVNGPINRQEVLSYIIALKQRFPIALLTYDQWADMDSKTQLTESGIRHKLLRYNRANKVKIYSELENTIIEGKMKIPYHRVLEQEMMGLRRKFTGSSGFSIYPSTDADGVQTDDIIDCIAGLNYSLKCESETMNLRSALVDLPVGVGGATSGISWRNMDGSVMGVGPGQQVFDNLNRATFGMYGGIKK